MSHGFLAKTLNPYLNHTHLQIVTFFSKVLHQRCNTLILEHLIGLTCLFFFWKHNSRPNLTSIWHPQVKLIGRKNQHNLHMHTTGFENPRPFSCPRVGCYTNEPSPLTRITFDKCQTMIQGNNSVLIISIYNNHCKILSTSIVNDIVVM